MEAPLPEHVLEKGTVVLATDMVLELGGQGGQQLIQTCTGRKGRPHTSARHWELGADTHTHVYCMYAHTHILQGVSDSNCKCEHKQDTQIGTH